MLSIHPKLPMRAKSETLNYYTALGFKNVSQADYDDYLILAHDQVEIHFFKFPTLDPKDNYGQVYIRCSDINALYDSFIAKGIVIHPNGSLADKPWGQREFSLLDPHHNLLTFGQGL